MNKHDKLLKLDTIPVSLVFLIFAMSSLMVLMLGGRIYRNTTSTINTDQNEQTALAYIWTKVKSCDIDGYVYQDGFNGITALFLKEEYGGITYKTVIYYHDGYVRELFFEEGLDFSLEDGMPVISSEELRFETVDDAIRVSAGTSSVMIYPRTSG